MKKRKVVNLYDINVCGPDVTGELSAPDRAYVKAMYNLDRAVMLCWIQDEDRFYLASIEQEIPHADR